MSVLQASPTRRDAKGYLKKYVPSTPNLSIDEKTVDSPFRRVRGQGHGFAQEPLLETALPTNNPIYAALVKFRLPHLLDNQTLDGVAKTLSQLRTLGLLSIVVIDCGDEPRETTREQSWRLSYAISKYGGPGAIAIEGAVEGNKLGNQALASYLPLLDIVARPGMIESALRRGSIPVIPSIHGRDSPDIGKASRSGGIILALTAYFQGLQFPESPYRGGATDLDPVGPEEAVLVERIIILEPLGGIPMGSQPDTRYRFINLEQEFSDIVQSLDPPVRSADHPAGGGTSSIDSIHVENLNLTKNALSLLPSSSSALIATPWAAANMTQNLAKREAECHTKAAVLATGFAGTVQTRSVQNPLIHNLLTDKPVYSSSLPAKHVPSRVEVPASTGWTDATATLIKRGMPLTIYPDPSTSPWLPPKPGRTRLRLTDTCLDLPRLVRLVEDSFNRKLDVQHYLNRVNEKLAGVIVAGEYEGGAILTWEQPEGLSEREASESGRLVPYLDKFAVLKSRQGSGGVADIVFKAMVRDCFPSGVCWRSRADNPVNKWYFERSMGTLKLGQWTMFWTTPEPTPGVLHDYGSVCHSVVPSWADNKHVLD